MTLNLGRTETALLYNKTGGAVAQGDVVIVDAGNATAFDSTTTSGDTSSRVGVVLDAAIANDAIGLVAFSGYVPKVNLASSASLGDFVKSHTVAKQGTPHAQPAVTGDFAQVLETGTTPSALLFGYGVITAAASAVYAPSGLTGATQATRYVGGTTSGAPVSGTFAVGDFVISQDGNMWICTVAGSPGTWAQPTAAAPAYIQLQDQKSSGTDGGTATSGSWETRDMNTEVHDAGGHCTLAANQFDLAAGTYEFEARCVGYRCSNNQARLANIDDSTYVYGETVLANTTNGNSVAVVSGKFTIAATKTFELQHRVNATKSTDGHGIAGGFGNIEVYATVELWKVA